MNELTEGELKNRINLLRQQIDQKDREIKSLYQQMKLHNTGAKELRARRDDLNNQAKELRVSAAEHKDKRDEVNKKIAELKNQRDDIKNHKSTYVDKIGELKKVRDELNSTARGRREFLENAYHEALNKITAADIPLEFEKSLFTRLHELGERVKAIRKANVIHHEMNDIYNKVGEVNQDIDPINALIHDLARESQEYHENMIRLFDQIDNIRPLSDEFHQRLSEIYKITRPIKEKIDINKKSINDLRSELDTYLEKMKDIQLIKDEKKQDEKRNIAKDKFQKKGWLSLEDLKILMENDEIEF